MKGMDLSQRATLREEILFGLVLLGLVIIFVRVVLAVPSAKIKTANSKREALFSEKEALTKFVATTPVLQNKTLLKKGIKTKILMGEIRSDYRRLSDILERVTEPVFLGGVTIDKISHQPAIQEKGFSRTDFNLQVRGSFGHVMRYLDQLEQFPALFYVQQLEVTAAEGQAQEVSGGIAGRFIVLGGMPAAPAASEARRAKEGEKK